MFWSVGWPLLWTGGFFCNLDILYGGLGIGKLQFLIKKKLTFFSAVIFFQFLIIKALDPYWIRIRNPDPYWSPTAHSGSGSGSGKNEYGSTTLKKTLPIDALPASGSFASCNMTDRKPPPPPPNLSYCDRLASVLPTLSKIFRPGQVTKKKRSLFGEYNLCR